MLFCLLMILCLSTHYSLSCLQITLICSLFALVGGCAEEVDDKVLRSAFIPFGEIIDVQMPLDYETGWYFPDIIFCMNISGLEIILMIILCMNTAGFEIIF